MTEKIIEQNVNETRRRDSESLAFLVVKIIFVLVLTAFLYFVYYGDEAKDIDLAEFETTLTSETEIKALMKKADDRDLMQFIGLNAADYDQLIYYRNTKALAVEELLIVKVGNQAQLSGVEEAVQKRIESQITAYSGYGLEQVAMLENAALKKIGNYYFYCTAADADKYKEVFLNALQ